MNNNYYEYEIIDAHSHIFPEKIVEAATKNIGEFYNLPMRGSGSTEMLLKSGKNINVSKYLVFSTATVPKQVRSINSFITKQCEENPEFIGFGTLHPKSDDLVGDIEQLLSLKLKGVKLHPDFQNFDMDSKEAYKIYEMLEDKLPILIHFGDSRYEASAPKKFVNVHRDFPKLKVIAPHLGGYERWEEAQKCLVGMDNLWFDTSSSFKFLTPELARSYILNFGIERCFFGSDFPMWNHKFEFEYLINLGFTHKENQMILADNFKRFLAEASK